MYYDYGKQYRTEHDDRVLFIGCDWNWYGIKKPLQLQETKSKKTG